MVYPYLSQDVDEPYDSGGATVPNGLWGRAGAGLFV
jgi:hypothetical protein